MEVTMEGFIYIWYDRKRNMYYIGCHWGTEDDGYICSNNRMRDAYRRRPNDFRRRIIQKGITRENLLDEEYKWLQLIPDNQLGKKYYNLRKHKWEHWSHDDLTRKTIGEKIASKNLGRKFGPMPEERKRKIGLANKGKPSHNKGKKMSEEQKRKIGETNAIKNLGKKHTLEQKQKISLSVKESWIKRKL